MLTVDGADFAYVGGLLNRSTYLAALSAADTEFTNANAPGYGRTVTMLSNWRPTGRLYELAGTVDLPTPTNSWPAWLRWALYSAMTAGNKLLEDVLETPGAAAETGASVGADAGNLFWFFAGVPSTGQASTTLDGAIDDAVTALVVDSATDIADDEYLVLGGTEIVQVDSGGGTTALTVSRGQLGTAARAHADGVSVVECDDSITTEGSRVCFNEGLLSGTRYLFLDDNKPGDTIGSDIIDDPIVITATEWTLGNSGGNRRARNNVIKSFGATTIDEPQPMYVGLADGNVATSNVLWRKLFTALPPDPDIGDTLSFPIDDLEILMAMG